METGPTVSAIWKYLALASLLIIAVQFYVIVSSGCGISDQWVYDPNSASYVPDDPSSAWIISSTSGTVVLLTLFSTLSSGLGAVPFFFVSSLSPFSICVYNSIAAGMMFSASLSLSYDALLYSQAFTIFGLFLGVLFVILCDHFLSQYENLSLSSLKGADARKVLLFVGVMTAHSLAEGVGMGMSFGGGMSLGLFVNIAIALHNLPEGIAVSLVLVSKGVSPWTAMLWATISAVPQPLMALPAFWFVDSFQQFLPIGLSFSAGAMIWMVFTEMLPEALEAYPSKKLVGTVACMSWLAMSVFQYYLESHV